MGPSNSLCLLFFQSKQVSIQSVIALENFLNTLYLGTLIESTALAAKL